MRRPVRAATACAVAASILASSAAAAPLVPAPPGPSTLALAQDLVVARRGDDPAALLFDYDPDTLARRLDLPRGWETARLVAAAKAAGEADRPMLRDALANIYAASMSPAELALELAYAESTAGRAELEKADLLKARQDQVAATYWPAYRQAYERVACRTLACPPTHDPNEPAPGGGEAWPTPSPEALAAAERYFAAAEIYQRPADARDAGRMVTEVVALLRANPNADRAQLREVEQAAMGAADAAIWPGYRRDMVRLYAVTFSAAELDGMAAKESSPAFKAVEAKPNEAAAAFGKAVLLVQRRMLADTKARFCAEVGCAAPEQPSGPTDDHDTRRGS
jgi:hypothetical protein